MWLYPESLLLSTNSWFAVRKSEDLYYLLKLDFIKKAVQNLRTLNTNQKLFFNPADLIVSKN